MDQTGRRDAQDARSGYTLIELLVVMIIMVIVSSMLMVGWTSLQRAYAFTSATNSARATARDAMDRMSSEIRTSQPPTAAVTTQFYLPASPTYPYMCGPNSCVFYSAYNSASAGANGAGPAATGTTPPSSSAMRLTAIWLRTADRALVWQRDTNNNGLDASDNKIILARDCVNAVVGRPIFTYNFRDNTSGVYSHSTTLDSSTVAGLRFVRIELVIDANLSHTPTYVDLSTTVRPRNAAAFN
jgi:prepilin-type N-terminal cleavage/methylation domain-containing protein